MNNKKILVVFTGGTIGSVIENSIIHTDNNTKFTLLNLYKTSLNAHTVEFDTIQPLNLLSENSHPRAWTILIESIEMQLTQTNYDGIIVTHGTDTLAYAANALHFYFSDLPIPLLLVSSDYSLDDEKANGLTNFSYAVDYIVKEKTAGVFVPYQNRNQDVTLHLGENLTCSPQLSSDFFSVSLLNKSDKTTQKFNLKPCFSEKILLIRPYPALNYSHCNLQGVDAVLHDLYHSGTACMTEKWDDCFSLLNFIERCQNEQVAIYLAPALRLENTYESTHILVNKGAMMLWDRTIENAFVKLAFAYGNFFDTTTIHEFLNQN